MRGQSSKWSVARLQEFERLFPTLSEIELLAAFPDKTVGQLRGKAIRLGLSRRPSGMALRLDYTHPAAVEGRTLFPGRVRAPGEASRLLVEGRDQRKIGGRVTRAGAWQGMPIFTLTLEERATCPRSCRHWQTCYGNAMHFAVRIDASAPDFLPSLEIELQRLQARHPGGFVVRLHVLGDFFSVAYVKAWERWLCAFPALHAFGYTAHPPGSRIGEHIFRLAHRAWDRFAIRWSSDQPGQGRAITVATSSPPKIAGVITCPAESFNPDGTKQTRGCSTCGLCWRAPDKTIRFIEHGAKGKPSPERLPTSRPSRLIMRENVLAAVAEFGSQQRAASALGLSLGKVQRTLRKGG